MFRVSVPATSANLGAAFDSAAIALSLRMTARAKPSTNDLRLRFSGPERPTHGGLADLVIAGMALFADNPLALKLNVSIHNTIPLGVGLGSSAAALICGAMLAAHAMQREVEREELLERVAQLEGHADNAAAALYGGLSFVISDEKMRTLTLGMPCALSYMLVIPQQAIDTKESRQSLPDHYPRDIVAHSLQRASMLAASLASGNLTHLNAAMRDGVHQRYRSTLYPGLSEALEQQDADTCSVLSGSGPTVLLISRADPAPIAMRIGQCFTDAGIRNRTLRVRPDSRGLIVLSRGVVSS